MFGFTMDDYADEMTADVWPDQLDAVNTFVAMGTQWRCGPGGVYGLDYNTLPAVMDMIGIDADKRAEVFDAIRTMEDAALEEMHKE